MAFSAYFEGSQPYLSCMMQSAQSVTFKVGTKEAKRILYPGRYGTLEMVLEAFMRISAHLASNEGR